MRSTPYGLFDAKAYLAGIPALVRHAASSTTHSCNRAVKSLLTKGGIRYPGESKWIHARDSGALLAELGFSVVASATSTNQLPKDYTPVTGDVVVVNTGFMGGKHSGHIAVWTGSSWVSDFRQRRAIPYNKPAHLVTVYRHHDLM